MSQQKPKFKIEAKPHNSVVINQPMVRTYSTGGGHGPEDTLVEGDEKIVTKKWQGYPPENLNLVGHPRPPDIRLLAEKVRGDSSYTVAVDLLGDRFDVSGSNVRACSNQSFKVKRSPGLTISTKS